MHHSCSTLTALFAKLPVPELPVIRRTERPQRPFSHSQFQGIFGIVPVETANSETGGFVNSTVTHPAGISMSKINVEAT